MCAVRGYMRTLQTFCAQFCCKPKTMLKFYLNGIFFNISALPKFTIMSICSSYVKKDKIC